MKEPYLINATGQGIQIPYYEIGSYAEKVVNEYINLSDENKLEFQEFQEDYVYFKPYFDFLISHLGYKFVNPFISKVSVLTYKDGYFMDSSIPNMPQIPLATDENYKINFLSVSSISSSIISPNGFCFKVQKNKSIYTTYEKVLKMILIEKMIYDKKIYDNYINSINNLSSDFEHNIYNFFEYLGYIRLDVFNDNTGFVSYDSLNLTDTTSQYLLAIEKLYPKIHLIDQNIKKQESDLYEGRRL